MKKILFVLLALIAIGNAMARGSDEKKVTLNVIGYGDNSNQEGISWKRMIEAFQAEHPDININDELLYDQPYHEKVTARLASGDVPHIAYMGADARWGAPWQEASQQIDNRPYIDTNIFDLSLIPEMGPSGERYYLPLGTSNITTVLFANESLIKSLGFDLPKTYADLIAMVPAARKAGLKVISLDGADGWAWGSCLLSALIARTSGDANWPSKAVKGEYKFTDKAMVDALSIIKVMADDGIMGSETPLVDYGANIAAFSNQKALFFIQGQWASGSVENPDVRNSMKLMAFPDFPGQKGLSGSAAAAMSVGYGITRQAVEDGVDKQAALLLTYLNREEEATQRLRDGAIVAPIIKNYKLPSDLPPEVAQKVNLALNVTNTEVIDAFLTGPPNDALNAGMQAIFVGEATPEQIAAQVEKLARQ